MFIGLGSWREQFMVLRLITFLPATLLFLLGEQLDEWYMKASSCRREWRPLELCIPVTASGPGENT